MKENVVMFTLGFQAVLLVSQLTIFLLRRTDQIRSRFLMLIVGFIAHNLLVNFIPGHILGTEVKYMAAFFLSFVLSLFFIRFLLLQLALPGNIHQISLKSILGILCIVLIFPFFLNLNISKVYIAAPMLGVVCLLVFSALGHISRQLTSMVKLEPAKKTLLKWCFVATVILPAAPVLLFVGDFEVLYLVLTNICLFCAFMPSLQNQIRSSIEEYNSLSEVGYFEDITLNYVEAKLSEMQYKVAIGILKEKTYEEIAEELFISSSGCRKHGSDLFLKLGCINKKGFIERFGYLRHQLEPAVV